VLLWLFAIGAACAAVVIAVEDVPLVASSRGELMFAYAAFMLRTFTLHAAIACALAMLCAAALHRARLAVVLSALAMCFAWPARPRLLQASEPPPGQRVVTVLSVNLLYNNSGTDDAVALIREVRPDVLLLQEYTPHWHEQLVSERSDEFPHQVHEIRGDAFGQAIFSRFALVEPPVRFLPPAVQATSDRRSGVVGLHDAQLRAVLGIDGAHVVVQCVHTMPPGGLSLFREQRAHFASLADLARTETRPMLIAGDFNATMNSRHFAALQEAGLRDTHAEAGSGLGHTWPALGPLRLVPGIRIDHAMVNDGLSVVESRVLGHVGSDHLPVLVRVSVNAVSR
jgi:endonuclease/exonuclease/phosphatase (EEP) superfamily protein YafD